MSDETKIIDQILLSSNPLSGTSMYLRGNPSLLKKTRRIQQKAKVDFSTLQRTP